MFLSLFGFIIALVFICWTYLALFKNRFKARYFGWCAGVVLGVFIGGSFGIAGFGNAINAAPVFGLIGGVIGILLVGEFRSRNKKQ